jgi:hypothetical protein
MHELIEKLRAHARAMMELGTNVTKLETSSDTCLMGAETSLSIGELTVLIDVLVNAHEQQLTRQKELDDIAIGASQSISTQAIASKVEELVPGVYATVVDNCSMLNQ